MDNKEAAKILTELSKHTLLVVDEDRFVTSHEHLAIGKAVKALKKLQSKQGEKKQ